MIWIIGGTAETHSFIDELQTFTNDYIITIATRSGEQFLSNHNTLVGRMNYEEMLIFIRENNITVIADLSHPFASIVSENAEAASKELGVSYLRYLRTYNSLIDDSIYVENYYECYKLLKSLKGNIFFTTGSKYIKNFQDVRGNNRFIYRILPSSESLQVAEEAGVSMKDIIAMLGPFSCNTNEFFFKKYDIDYCVTKESGGNSGFQEKIEACKKTGVIPIIIRRPSEVGYKSFDELIEKIKEVVFE